MVINALDPESLMTQDRSPVKSVFKLPGQFPNDLSLIIISFEAWQVEITDRWLDFAQTIQEKHPNFGCYEFPLALTADEDKPLSICTDEQDAWKKIRIDNTDKVQALLIDRDGNILWNVQGSPNKYDTNIFTNLIFRALIEEKIT